MCEREKDKQRERDRYNNGNDVFIVTFKGVQFVWPLKRSGSITNGQSIANRQEWGERERERKRKWEHN